MRRMTVVALRALLCTGVATFSVGASGALQSTGSPGSAVSTPAVTALNASEWFTEEDYPAEAIKLEAHGRVRFEVQVNASGRAESCSVLESAHPILDARTCELVLQRGRFTAAGKPSSGELRYTAATRWVLPDTASVPGDVASSAARSSAATDGALLLR